MKLNAFITGLFMLCIFVLSSCGKDDNGNELNGNYKISSITIANCTDPDENLDLQFDENGCIMEQGFEVCVVGDWIFNSGDYTLSLDVTFGGSSLGEAMTETGTYTIDGSKITLCSGGTDCQEASIAFDGDTITVSGFMDDDGCDQTIVAKKN